DAGARSGAAALIPAELFVPQVSARGGPVSVHVRVVTGRDSLIAEVGAATTADDSVVVAALSSPRYALKVSISTSQAGLAATSSDLRTVGTVASGLLAIFVLAMSLLLPRRERENPIAEIESAMKAGEFVPYFQPIVDIRSGRLRGAEVLVRWRKPDGTLVLPDAFIPLMESSGLIHTLTRNLMQKVRDEAGPSIGRRTGPRISFHFSV